MRRRFYINACAFFLNAFTFILTYLCLSRGSVRKKTSKMFTTIIVFFDNKYLKHSFFTFFFSKFASKF